VPDVLRTETYEERGASEDSPWALRILHAADAALAGRVLVLGERLRIGRRGGDGLDLALEDGRVSRRHATVSRVAGGLEIEDHDSKNGTFVRGARVVRRRPLAQGDLVRIGETLLELDRVAAAEAGEADPVLLGDSPALRRLLLAIDRVATATGTVLVVGETGAGKELVARRLHERSGRPGPLVAVNCGAIPATLVEATLFGHRKGAFTDAAADATGFFAGAAGGTLFLDEIGVLPLELQPKLLRVLESREYFPVGATTARRSDARVVAATNVELRAEAEAGRFRRDLYARLAEHRLDVPPLRARRADVPILVRHFLAQLAPGWSVGLSASFLEPLLLHDWPMNVRELRAVVQAVALARPAAPALAREHLPPALLGALPPGTVPRRASAPLRDELERLLQEHKGNVGRLAERLGTRRTQVYRWLARHGIDATRFR
jgi:DNA-binding NtrC family response regulator